MSTYRFARIKSGFSSALEELPTSVDLPAAGIASVRGDVEAFHRVAFEDLPKEVIQQLRYDGTRGEGRSLDDARAVYDHNVPADAHGSTEGVAAIANDPTIDWGHKTPFVHGGSNDASNGVYLPETLNSHIGDRPMTPAEVHQAEAFTHQIALDATPGVSGDLGHVAVHTAETSLYGGAIGGGMAVAHRLAQIKGFRDAGRHDLAMDAEDELGSDAARGMVNGVVRGTSVAVTQAILGANPLTAGIGLVAPDVYKLLSEKDQLSEEEFQQKTLKVASKGALAVALACAGPMGWLGLAGISIVSAYDKANQQGASRQLPA
jgi:hypothetical protein